MAIPLNTIISTIPTLTDDTYKQWANKCRVELGILLLPIVEGTWKAAPDNPDTDGTQFADLNRHAMRILLASIVEPQYDLIENCTLASEIWRTLEINYKDTSLERISNVVEQIYALEYDHTKTIKDHITAFNKLHKEIKTFDAYKSIPEGIWVSRFLRSLPDEFAMFARSYKKELDKTTLDELFSTLRSEYKNQAKSSSAKTNQISAVSANIASSSIMKKPPPKKRNNKPNDKGKAPAKSNDKEDCKVCKRLGHSADDCYVTKMRKFYEEYNPSLYSNTKKPSTSAFTVTYEAGLSEIRIEHAFLAQSSRPDIWVKDSGCTNDMSPIDKSCFTNYTPASGSNVITGINGTTTIHGRGTLILTTPNGGKMILKDVIHAPGLPYSLLSIGKAMLRGENLHHWRRHWLSS
jgi:hypothetical protein